jgi:hypothetical protein
MIDRSDEPTDTTERRDRLRQQPVDPARERSTRTMLVGRSGSAARGIFEVIER